MFFLSVRFEFHGCFGLWTRSVELHDLVEGTELQIFPVISAFWKGVYSWGCNTNNSVGFQVEWGEEIALFAFSQCCSSDKRGRRKQSCPLPSPYCSFPTHLDISPCVLGSITASNSLFWSHSKECHSKHDVWISIQVPNLVPFVCFTGIWGVFIQLSGE